MGEANSPALANGWLEQGTQIGRSIHHGSTEGTEFLVIGTKMEALTSWRKTLQADQGPAFYVRGSAMRRLLLCILSLNCALAVTGAAQSQENLAANFSQPPEPGQRPECGNLTTIEGCLALYGVPLTKDGMLAAFRSGDPAIRMLDEEVLAYRHVKDAIPELSVLLITTYDPNERIGLANALAELGEEQGVETLRRYCDDTTTSVGERLTAARFLRRYRPKSCSGVLMAALHDDSSRLSALHLIPEFKELSPEQSAAARSVLLKSLADEDFSLRLVAAETIASTGDVTYIPALQAAIEKESIAFVRDDMKFCLKEVKGR